MHFIFAGCSHTNGSEIEEPWHPGSPEKAYGSYIAREFNASFENISGPGWSNRWIFNKLYQRLEKLSEEERKNTFVLIGWTSFNRIPIWDPYADKPYHLCPQLLRYPSNDIKKWHKVHYLTSWPQEEWKNYEHGLVVSTQSLLKSLQIPYLMHWAIHPIIPTENSEKLIDAKRFYYYNDRKKTFWEVYKKYHWDNSQRWKNHAPETYHIEFSKQLINYIKENKLTNV